MARTLGSVTFQCGWQPNPEPSLQITPAVIVATDGVIPSRMNVYADIYDNGQLKHPDGLSAPDGFDLSTGKGSGDTAGVTFQFGITGERRFWRFSGTVTGTVTVGLSVEYDGRIYYGSVQIVKVDSVQGKSIHTPPVMQWSDYPTGYDFEGGDGDSERVDYVIHGQALNGCAMVYRCFRSHKKGCGNDEPGKTQLSAYWKPADGGPFHIVATDFLLAASAYIKLLSTNGIGFFDNSGTLMGEIAGGASPDDMLMWLGNVVEDPMFGLTGRGMGYFGGCMGRHIEIDPEMKEIRFYDSSGNLCACHGGRTLTVAEAVPGGATTAEATLIAKASASWTSIREGKTVESAQKTASGSGRLKVTIPAYTGTLTLNSPLASSDNPGAVKPYSTANLRAELLVDGQVAASKIIWFSNAGATLTGSTSSGTVSSQATTLTASVANNSTYKLRLTLFVNIGGGAGSGGCLTATAGADYKGQLVATLYQAQYMANGFVISTNSNNYVYFLFDATGTLHCKCMANGVKMFGND